MRLCHVCAETDCARRLVCVCACRYFFRLHRLHEEEDRRLALLKRAATSVRAASLEINSAAGRRPLMR